MNYKLSKTRVIFSIMWAEITHCHCHRPMTHYELPIICNLHKLIRFLLYSLESSVIV